MSKVDQNGGANVNQRRSLRLAGYDYSHAGAYFVTVVTQGRECRFGRVSGGKMELNGAGRMVGDLLDELPRNFTNVAIDEFVVMPNHIHAIIEMLHVGAPLVGALECNSEASLRDLGATTRVAPTLGSVIGSFKSLTTIHYLRRVRDGKWPGFEGRLWQRNYLDHIIRDDESLDRIRAYILDNPVNWALDDENPSRMA